MQQTVYRPVPGYDDLYAGTDGSIVLAGKGELEQRIYRNTRYKSVRISREIGIRVVHRLVAAAFYGPKPKGMHVRHGEGGQLDDTPINLCYGTASDNQQDSIRAGTQWQVAKTSCPQGHEYTPDNTYMSPNGSRQCRKCRYSHTRNGLPKLGRGKRLTTEQKRTIEELLTSSPELPNRTIAKIVGTTPPTIARDRRRKMLRDKELGAQ